MKVCIDAGHGGSDPGAIGTDPLEINEKALNLSIALKLEVELLSKGYDVYVTRRIDRTISLGARVKIANRRNVDLFISIHCNSADIATAEGIETWVYPYSQLSGAYAENVQDRLIQQFPDHKNRGVKEANFKVLRETKMAAILIECEFLSNPTQLLFLNDNINQNNIAKAIAEAI